MKKRLAMKKRLFLLTVFAVTASSTAVAGDVIALANESKMTLPFTPSALLWLGTGDFTATSGTSVVTWNFEDSSSLLADAYGHGAEMATAGTGQIAAANDAERGNVLSFDGASYIKGPNSDGGLDSLPAGEIGLPWTVAVWVKPASDCDSNAVIFFFGEQANAKQALLRFATADNSRSPVIFTTYGGNNMTRLSAATDIKDGNWHHFAVSYDGSSKFMAYYDVTNSYSLVLKTTTAEGDYFKPSKKNFQVGAQIGRNPYLYKGLMDDFTFVNYCMTADEIAAVAACGVPSAPADVEINATGSLFDADGRGLEIGTLSGTGAMGGIESRDSTVLVGEGVSSATGCVYSAMIRGKTAAPVSVIKRGAQYEQVLSGVLENVTNVSVEAGTLALSRPVGRAGLVALYPFDGFPGAGFDAGPAGLRLKETNDGASALSFVADGIFGKALHFPGTAYLSSQTASLPSRFQSGNSPYTVSVWIRPATAACTDKVPIFGWGKSGSARQLSYLRFNGANELRFSNYSADLSVSVPKMDDGEWHHVVVTYDGARGKSLYFDGEQKEDQTLDSDLAVAADQVFYIGHGPVNANTYSGDMDEFMLFDHAWSAGEVADEYSRRGRKAAGSVAAATLLPAPAAHWTFDDAADMGADSSGNALNLSIAGATMRESDAFTCGGAIRLRRDSSVTNRLYIVDDAYDTAALPWGNKPYTIVMRYKPDTSQGNENTSVVSVGLTAGSGHVNDGRMFKVGPGRNKERSVRFSVGTTLFARDNWPEGIERSDDATDRQRWITAAVVYTPVAGGTENIIRAYVDGVLVGEAAGEGNAMNIATKRFEIGSDPNSSTDLDTRKSLFAGLIDDVQVYNVALSEGEIALVTRQLADAALKATSGAVLPEAAKVSVADGSTLDVRSTEHVAALSGAGAVYIAPLATLTVDDMSGFSGSVAGHGTLEVKRGYNPSRVDVADTVRLDAKLGLIISFY